MSATRQQHRERPRSRAGARAFTLVELLTVIAIIGILAAILVPSISAARGSAGKAATKVRFNQWAAAIEGFRQEYGYYPAFDASRRVNGGVNGTEHPFHDVLAGRRRDGTPLDPGSAAGMQNRKGTPFHAFTGAEFTDASTTSSNLLCDASGNTEIAVLVDRNLDGVINAADTGGVLPLVGEMRPGEEEFPATGVRAGVIFYAPAPGATTTAPLFVFSWK